MKKKLLIVLTIVIAMFSVSVLYVNDYYRSEAGIQRYLENTDEVSVNTISEGLFFDGKGTEEAFIFYPGGKVEYTAYAPLMQKLAREGIDCFLLKMPIIWRFSIWIKQVKSKKNTLMIFGIWEAILWEELQHLPMQLNR